MLRHKKDYCEKIYGWNDFILCHQCLLSYLMFVNKKINAIYLYYVGTLNFYYLLFEQKITKRMKNWLSYLTKI